MQKLAFKQHTIENMMSYTHHSLPCTPHMRCMWRIEHSRAVVLPWVLLYIWIYNFLFHLEVLYCSNEICSTIGAYLLSGTPYGKKINKSRKCITKSTGTQCLYAFSVHCSCTHARENDCPPFGVRATSFSATGNHLSCSKHIDFYICERWSHLKSICRQVRHLMALYRTTKLSTCHTLVE